MIDHSVRHLLPTEANQAGALLALAFQGDPLFNHVLPVPGRWPAAMPLFFTAMARYGLDQGTTLTTPSLEGVCVWLPPGHDSFTPWPSLRAGLPQSLLRLGPAALIRMLRSSHAMHQLRSTSIPRPHWYLLVLAVHPLRQGQGIGSLLLQPVLKQADFANQACYLETANPANLAFYQRWGFRTSGESRVPGGPPFWGMVRDPAAGG